MIEPVVIHQALCGQVSGGGFGLLATTSTEDDVHRGLSFQADLSDRPSQAGLWLPAVQAFSWKNYFLWIKTFPDYDPQVRSGRVFTHVLLADKEAMSKINNISQVLSHFLTTVDKEASLSPINLHDEPPAEWPFLTGQMVKATELLISKATTPVVWLGQANFEEFILRLWPSLSPVERLTLRVDFRFTRTDLPKSVGGIHLICVPDSEQAHWYGRQDVVTLTTGELPTPSDASAYLLSLPAGTSFKRFVNSLSQRTPLLDELHQLGIAHAIWTRLPEEPFPRVWQLYQLMTKFSASDSSQSPIYKPVVERLVITLTTAPVLAICAIGRNEAVTQDPPLVAKLTQPIFDRMVSILTTASAGDNCLQLISTSETSPTATWLKNLVNRAVMNVLADWRLSTAELVWYVLVQSLDAGDYLLSRIGQSADVEQSLLDTRPELPPGLLSSLLPRLRSRGWWQLQAALLLAEQPLESALLYFDQYEPASTNVAGLRYVAAHVPGNDFVTAAVKQNTPKVLDVALCACQNEPALMTSIDVQQLGWQELWQRWLQAGHSATLDLPDPHTPVFTLLNMLRVGKVVNIPLLETLSQTELGDLTTYPDRSELWTVLPKEAKSDFLAKTAQGLLNQIEGLDWLTIEPPLHQQLSHDNTVNTFLYNNRQNLNRTLTFFEHIKLPEEYLRTYVANYPGSPSSIEATRLGQLIIARNWKKCALEIYSKPAANRSWQIALSHCLSLLPKLDRFIARLRVDHQSTPSSQEWWDAFSELVVDLLPEGPTQNGFWERAGGHKSDLQQTGTGRDMWDAAIRLVRGGYSYLSVAGLINSLQTEFNQNTLLSLLQTYQPRSS